MCDGNMLSRAPELKIGLVNDIRRMFPRFPLIVAVNGVSLCGLIVRVYLFVLVCVVVYLFSHTTQV